MARTRLAAVSCFVGLVLSASCLADGLTRDEFMELLEGGTSKAAMSGERSRSGDPYLGLPMGRSESGRPAFAPVEGLDTPEAVPFLIDVVKQGPGPFAHLGDRYDDLARCYAALCLGLTKDSRALEPLVEALKGRIVEDRKRPIWLPAVAAQSLAFLGDYRAIEPLVEAMHHDHPRVRASAAGALSILLEKVMEPLAEAVNDPDRLTSDGARLIWGRLLGRCLEVYQEELRHPDPQRRALAASSLAIYLKEPLKRVRTCSTSADQQVREAAQKALAEIRDVVGPAEIELEGE